MQFSNARILYSLVPGQIQFARNEQSPLAQRPINNGAVGVVVVAFAVGSVVVVAVVVVVVVVVAVVIVVVFGC